MKRLLERYTGPGTEDTLPNDAADPRITGPFTASVRGIDAQGVEFQVETTLDDLSANDFRMQLSRRVNAGEKLFVVARVYEATLAMIGIVSLNETQNGGGAVTVSIRQYRFVSSSKSAKKLTQV